MDENSLFPLPQEPERNVIEVQALPFVDRSLVREGLLFGAAGGLLFYLWLSKLISSSFNPLLVLGALSSVWLFKMALEWWIRLSVGRQQIKVGQTTIVRKWCVGSLCWSREFHISNDNRISASQAATRPRPDHDIPYDVSMRLRSGWFVDLAINLKLSDAESLATDLSSLTGIPEK